MVFLQGHGLGTARAVRIYKTYGDDAIGLVKQNPYQALDTLDDNRAGELSGAELDGLAVWFDRNGDGVADLGEVILVDQLDIAAISCRATDHEGSSLANMTGLRMTDSRTLPTFDWVASQMKLNRSQNARTGQRM